MATLTLRIDDAVRDQIQELAEGQDISVSDLVRSQIDKLLDQGDREEPRRRIVPESMTAVDRKQLSLLHKILARLVEEKTADERLGHDGDTVYQLNRAQALDEGWTAEYDMEFIAMEPELSRRDCGLVMDLLDMFRILKYSAEQVTESLSEQEARILRFHGFDQSDSLEGRLLGYARWLVSDGKRWQEQAEVFSAENDWGNAHSPWLGSYQRMLEAYEPIWRDVNRRQGRSRNLLTVDELQQVAAAVTRPRSGSEDD